MDWGNFIDLLLFSVVGGFLLWKLVSRNRPTPLDRRVTAALNVLESRANQLEREVEQYRRRMEEQIHLLAKIGEQANRLLERGRTSSFPKSWEEDEIRSTLTAQEEKNVIPTLTQVEQTKTRLKQQTQFDLKTLLKDQLA